MARLARAVSQELGRVFRRSDITDAIKLCFEHSRSFVTEYIEENFTLAPPDSVIVATENASPPDDAPHSESGTDSPVGTMGSGFTSDNESKPQASEDAQDEGEEVSAQEIAEEKEDNPDVEQPGTSTSDYPRPHPTPKPAKPSLIERFAKKQGFRKDQDNRFFDDHGNWISKATGALFPWELRSAAGEVERHYWPKEHCLEREPLQLDAEIWSVVERNPERYFLVLTNPEGNPTEVSGTRLREIRERGDLTLHPSTYRLVYEHDEEL